MNLTFCQKPSNSMFSNSYTCTYSLIQNYLLSTSNMQFSIFFIHTEWNTLMINNQRLRLCLSFQTWIGPCCQLLLCLNIITSVKHHLWSKSSRLYLHVLFPFQLKKDHNNLYDWKLNLVFCKCNILHSVLSSLVYVCNTNIQSRVKHYYLLLLVISY